VRRWDYYSVEYFDHKGFPAPEVEEDEYLSRSRAHELALRWVAMHPDRGAIIYHERTKWYPKAVPDRKGNPQRDGAKLTETVCQALGWDYRGPRPLRSIMQRRGRIGEMDVPVIRPERPLLTRGAA
jgi:hypothetical protein